MAGVRWMLDYRGEELFPVAGVVAILAIYRSVATGDERHLGRCAAGSAGGAVHCANVADSPLAPRLSTFTQQERIKRIRAHVEVHQVAIAAGTVTLAAGRTKERTGKAAKLAELLLCFRVAERVVTLLADDLGRHG